MFKAVTLDGEVFHGHIYEADGSGFTITLDGVPIGQWIEWDELRSLTQENL